MPRHATKISFKAGPNHRNWKGGDYYYQHREARKVINCPEGMVVHHKNGDWRDNSPSNLQVITQSEHVAIHNRQRKGSIKPQSIIRRNIKKVIQLKEQGYKRCEIAEMLGISYRMVKRCLLSKWRCCY